VGMHCAQIFRSQIISKPIKATEAAALKLKAIKLCEPLHSELFMEIMSQVAAIVRLSCRGNHINEMLEQ
jgi:hypothetical protein